MFFSQPGDFMVAMGHRRVCNGGGGRILPAQTMRGILEDAQEDGNNLMVKAASDQFQSKFLRNCHGGLLDGLVPRNSVIFEGMVTSLQRWKACFKHEVVLLVHGANNAKKVLLSDWLSGFS
ncbi:hypothetical protein ACP70R_031680 [Stipagrostis hirtigluma subsp. patula]